MCMVYFRRSEKRGQHIVILENSGIDVVAAAAEQSYSSYSSALCANRALEQGNGALANE